MIRSTDIAKLRREYGGLSLDEHQVDPSPMIQFERWFEDALHNEAEANAMTLATVDEHGMPDARIVLLKGLSEEKLVFYTNYDSTKAKQLEANSRAALVFYWPNMTRQVRFRGQITRTTELESTTYFTSRPLASQISAIVSPQSQVIQSRAELEQAYTAALDQAKKNQVNCPHYWGGYALHPLEVEFFQGRDNRLHDRIRYTRQANQWQKERLAP